MCLSSDVTDGLFALKQIVINATVGNFNFEYYTIGVYYAVVRGEAKGDSNVF